MVLVRDVFQCRPGKAAELAGLFKKTIPSMQTEDQLRNCRVMVDAVGNYWTVVMECEFESLAGYEEHMAEYARRDDVRQSMAGYMDLVEGGHREIFRIL